MATYGFAFRATSGYVTDGANDTYVLAETSAQTRNGITFNWTSSAGGPAGVDVDNTVDVRLAGVNQNFNDTTVFNVTLPATGAYNVRLALGAAALLGDQKVVIKDNGTIKLTVGPSTVAAGSYKDAAGVTYTTANWPGSNSAVSVTFSSTVFTLELSGGTSYGCLAYLSLTQTGALGGRASLLGVGR